MSKEVITLKQYFMGRDVQFSAELTETIKSNAQKLVTKVNLLLNELKLSSVVITSGWRPAGINSKVPNAAPNSKHQTGLAVDLGDKDGSLAKIMTENLDVLQKLGLYLEDPRWTKGWVHIQSVAPGSGRRVFIPSTKPPTVPDVWSGQYDPKFNKA